MFKTIDRLLSTKSLKVNAIFNALYQILALLAPLITTPYVSRVFGSAIIGDYNYYYSILGYFTLISTFGFNDYGTKAIAEYRNDKENKSKIFWGIMSAKFVFSTICLISYLFITLLLFKDNPTAIYIFLGMSIYILSIMIDPTFYFQGEENFISISIRNMTMRIITVVFTFVLVKDSSDIIKYTLVLSIGNIISILVIFFSFKKGSLNRPKIKELHFIKYIKEAFPFFVPSLAVSLFTSLNQTMIGALGTNSSESGYYSQALRIINVLCTLAGSLSIIMLSRMSYLFKNGSEEEIKRKITKTFEAFWAFAMPITFGLIAINRYFIPVFLGNDYNGSINIIYLLSPVVILSPLNTLFGSLYYRPRNKIWIQTTIILVSSILNIILCFVLIPKYNSIGTSIARLSAELFQLPFLIHFSKSYLPIQIVFKSFIKTFDNSIIMAIVLFFFDKLLIKFTSSYFILLIIEILLGMIIYFLMALITKDEFIYPLTKNILSKIKTILRKYKN